MIILVHKNGQLGNRLAYLRAFLSVAMEHRLDVVNLIFDEYARYFKGTSFGRGFFFPKAGRGALLSGTGLRWLLLHSESLIRRHGQSFGVSAAEAVVRGEFSFLDGQLVALAKRHHLIFYEGWPIVSSKILLNHADKVRECFSLVEPLAEKVAACLVAAKGECDLLIGIHIRQGDYLTWQGGRHYFSSEQYATLMRHIVTRHPGKAIRFFVCSNVDQEWAFFDEFSLVRGIKGVVEDMYILAGCDEIYGPQSSYSGWAAFYGKKPLYWVGNPDSFELVVPKID